jgi:hypothetical protein
MAENESVDKFSFWQVVDQASKRFDDWEDWKKRYGYAAYPDSGFVDEVLELTATKENSSSTNRPAK